MAFGELLAIFRNLSIDMRNGHRIEVLFGDEQLNRLVYLGKRLGLEPQGVGRRSKYGIAVDAALTAAIELAIERLDMDGRDGATEEVNG
jgi:hypothetical protein